MGHIVVAENLLLGARAPHALDHRGVVQLVRQDEAVGQELADGRDRRLVGDEARSEDESRFLAVQIGELLLQLDQRMVVAGNVARAAGAGTHLAGRLLECGDDVGVLAHAEIIANTRRDLFRLPVGARWRGNAPLCARSAKTR